MAIFEAPVLLTRVDLANDGRFVPETVDWATFWAPLRELRSQKLDGALSTLHAAWQEYILSRFNTSLQREYCFRYFSLLERLLLVGQEVRRLFVWRRALRTAAGFECFGLRAPVDTRVLAGGTTTLRNPCYLLAKLKWPKALDDSKFLPLIAVQSGETAPLFYHYRQYRLAKDSSLSVLLYLAASRTHRSVSFSLVDSLASGVGSSSDPRVAQRARHLVETILKPIVQAAHPRLSEQIDIEFVDVGAGTGALTAALCRGLLAWGLLAGFSPRFRLWFVDLSLADPARFLRAASLRGSIDSLMFVGNDYRGWLARARPLPRSTGLRLSLVSKLFNNLSRFSISYFPAKVLPSQVVCSDSFKEGRYVPARCLAPGGAGPKELVVSNSRVDLDGGRIFVQASLSQFYRALQLLSTIDGANPVPQDGMWLPLRSFDPECLIASEGGSVLGRLLEHCDYVIVEDADLRPRELSEHLREFALHALTACDMTKALGLTGNHTYVLWKRGNREPPLVGERVW